MRCGLLAVDDPQTETLKAALPVGWRPVAWGCEDNGSMIVIADKHGTTIRADAPLWNDAVRRVAEAARRNDKARHDPRNWPEEARAEIDRLREWLEWIAKPVMTGHMEGDKFVPHYASACKAKQQAAKKALAGHPAISGDEDGFWEPV